MFLETFRTAWRHTHADHQFFLYYGSRQAQRKSLEDVRVPSAQNTGRLMIECNGALGNNEHNLGADECVNLATRNGDLLHESCLTISDQIFAEL